MIDHTQEDDFTRGDEGYDLILDIARNHSLSECRRALTPDGTHVLVGHDNYGKGMRRWVGLLPRMCKLMAMSPFVSQPPYVRFSMPDKKESMALLKQVLETGKHTPCIDRVYPLSEVPDAIRCLRHGVACPRALGRRMAQTRFAMAEEPDRAQSGRLFIG